MVELSQFGGCNIAVAAQRGASNQTTIRQVGKVNDATVDQDGGKGFVDLSQRGINNAAVVVQSGRIGRATVSQAGEVNYLASYQNGGFSLLMIDQVERARGGYSREGDSERTETEFSLAGFVISPNAAEDRPSSARQSRRQ